MGENNKYPLVSIITVSYNSEDTIERTIKAVLNQSYHNIEYLIIDGKSVDRTFEIASGYKDAFQEKGIQYTIISEQDDGLYDAMNKGISMAHGEIIGIINSDDWFENDAAQIAAAYYLKCPYDILMCSVYRWKGKNKISKKIPHVRRYKTSTDFCHPGMFVTKRPMKELVLMTLPYFMLILIFG